MYLIQKGSVDLFQNSKKVNTFSKGNYLDEKSLFTNVIRQFTAVASEPCTLYTLDKADLASVIEP